MDFKSIKNAQLRIVKAEQGEICSQISQIRTILLESGTKLLKQRGEDMLSVPSKALCEIMPCFAFIIICGNHGNLWINKKETICLHVFF